MAQFKIETDVAAPPEKVFAYAADFANAPEHIRGITKMEMLTEGPVGVGTRFRETRVMFKREATEEMEVTAFEPPRRYTLGCESHGCRYHTEMLFTPKGEGTTMSMTFEATPLTFMAKVMGFIFKPMMKSIVKECGKDLADVKAAAEASSGSSPQ